jgi:hypothetical protein
MLIKILVCTISSHYVAGNRELGLENVIARTLEEVCKTDETRGWKRTNFKVPEHRIYYSPLKTEHLVKKSGYLLLAFVSTVILGFGRRRDP